MERFRGDGVDRCVSVVPIIRVDASITLCKSAQVLGRFKFKNPEKDGFQNKPRTRAGSRCGCEAKSFDID